MQLASPVKGETLVCPAAHEISMGCVSMFAQESLPPAIDEQATARQLGLSEVEMARTLRAAVCSGVVLHALIKLVCGEFIVFRTR